MPTTEDSRTLVPLPADDISALDRVLVFHSASNSTRATPAMDMVSTSAAIQSRLEGLTQKLFSVESYGAYGDGRILTDAAITTGTAILTSATGAFTSADVGKWILVQKAGSASGDLRTTVASVTNSTTVVLADSAATTVASSGRVFLGTECTAGIQAAINACHTAGGGKVYAPKGVYFIDGAFQAAHTTDGTHTAQIIFPTSGQTAAATTIEVVGEMTPNLATDGYLAGSLSKVPMTGTVFYKTRLSGDYYQDMISSYGSAASFGPRNYNTIIIDGIAFRNRSRSGSTQVDGQGTLLDATNMALFAARNCSFASEEVSEALVLQSSAGIRMPIGSNYCLAELRNVVIQGMGVGVQTGEHSLLLNVAIDGCDVGVYSTGAQHHGQQWLKVGVWRCKRPVFFSAETHVTGCVAFERWAGSGRWYAQAGEDFTGSAVQIRGKLDVLVGVAGGTYGVPTFGATLTRTTLVAFDLHTGAVVA